MSNLSHAYKMVNNSTHLLLSVLLVWVTLSTQSATALDNNHEGTKYYPSILRVGQSMPPGENTRQVETTDWRYSMERGKVVFVRYLGYSCSHCVEQLSYLNSLSPALKALGIKVVAVSSDNDKTISAMMERQQFDPELISVYTDSEDAFAKQISAVSNANGTDLDLHAVVAIDEGVIQFLALTDQPFMDVERLVAVFNKNDNSHELNAVAVDSGMHEIDRFLSNPIEITQVAGPSNGLKGPIDLEFSKSPLHPNDLWIVTTDTRGNAIAIVHQVGTPNQTIRLKQDSRASHFMWRAMGIAMADNGTFATGQNGQGGGGDPELMFMGPTLWSQDTAVFAARYQSSNSVLASHLDMLHQSPQCLGIAHDSANVYWVLDGKYQNIARYDFADPHEIGGVDHRDGVIWKYTDVSITPPVRGTPAHVVFDQKTKWLYYSDPGKGSVHRLNTRSGQLSQSLAMPASSAETLVEHKAVVNAVIETVIPGGLIVPTGMEYVNGRLLVAEKSGRLNIYNTATIPFELLGTIQTGASELLGITIGPDGMIYFADRSSGTVSRIATTFEPRIEVLEAVKAISRIDSIGYRITNPGNTTLTFDLQAEVFKLGTTVSTGTVDKVTVDVGPKSEKVVYLTIAADTLFDPHTVHCNASYSDRTSERLRANSIVVGKDLRKILVDDAPSEGFRFFEAVQQTSREGYVSLSPDVFSIIADSLHSIKTLLWNSGSFGEINPVEDVIIASLIKKEVDVLMVGDDAFSLRTDLPRSTDFFNQFGVRFLGADQRATDNGQRVFQGAIGDTITAGIASVDCQLPRLDHYRGGKYVTNVLFKAFKPTAVEILVDKDNLKSTGVRYSVEGYRGVILGFNMGRVLDGFIRTQLLNNSIAWLEAGANPDPIDTTGTTSVAELTINPMLLSISSNPVRTNATLQIAGLELGSNVEINLYSSAGQSVRHIHSGVLNSTSIPIDFNGLASGVYFVIVQSSSNVQHLNVVKQ